MDFIIAIPICLIVAVIIVAFVRICSDTATETELAPEEGEPCPVCGRQTSCNTTIADGNRICTLCSHLTKNYAAESTAALQGYLEEQKRRASIFNKTGQLQNGTSETIVIDEDNKMFYIAEKDPERQMIYRFHEVNSYRYVEPLQKTVTKKQNGVGRAIVGGALFGPTGAIVGASTAKEKTTARTIFPGFFSVDLTTHAGHDALALSNPPKGAEEFFTKCASCKATDNTDNVEEIIKYKRLLDEGIITPEEFEKKKKELLDL